AENRCRPRRQLLRIDDDGGQSPCVDRRNCVDPARLDVWLRNDRGPRQYALRKSRHVVDVRRRACNFPTRNVAADLEFSNRRTPPRDYHEAPRAAHRTRLVDGDSSRMNGYLDSRVGVAGEFSRAIDTLYAEYDRDGSPGVNVAVIK